MKLTKFISGALALLACASLALPASATDVVASTRNSPTVIQYANVTATANYTNSTTTASDITGASVTIPSTKRPLAGNSLGSSGQAQWVRVCYTADAGKATATTGTITILVNGTSYAAASRTIGVIRGTLAACALVARPVATSLVVKLQGVSGDSNTFTVYNAEMSVEVDYFA